MKSRYNLIGRMACAALISIMLAGTVNGEENIRGVKVFLDGRELTYDVNPKIVKDRCMVPIGQTIEYLTGTAPSWDDDTKTMSFEANGNQIQHKVGTSVVNVNGNPTMNYGVESFIEDGRTLIPLRMLSEATGCLLVWDDPSKTVILTTPNRASEDQDATEKIKVDAPEAPMPGSYNQPKPVDILEVSAVKPEIISAATAAEKMKPGESTAVTVVTNSSATRVKLVNIRSGEFLEVSDFSEKDGKRTFEIPWKITEPGRFNARIYAGNKITYENEYKIVTVVTDTLNPINLIDAYTYTNDIRLGRELYITAVTNEKATRVTLNTSEEEEVAATTEHNLDAAGNRVWRLKWMPRVKGHETLTVVADHGSIKDSLSLEIDVFEGDIKPVIKDVDVDTKDVFSGNVALITLQTNTAANVVWFQCDGYVGEKNFKHYDSDGVRTWYLNVEPLGGSGTISTITVYAQDADGNTAEENINVNIVGALVVEGGLTAFGPGRNSLKGAEAIKAQDVKTEPVIHKILSPVGAAPGGLAKVFVQTNGFVNTVLLDDNTDPEDENKIKFFCEGVNTQGDEKIFSFFVGIDTPRPTHINFTAVGKSGQTVKETYTVPLLIY